MNEYQYQERLRRAIIGKLSTEGLSLNSPWTEIETCLHPTVGWVQLINEAQKLKKEKERCNKNFYLCISFHLIPPYISINIIPTNSHGSIQLGQGYDIII